MRWTGNGLADGTAVTAGNANTTGNGDTVTFQTSGTGDMVAAGDGFDVWADNGGLRRLDTAAMSTARAIVAQDTYTHRAAPTTASNPFVSARSASAFAGYLCVSTTGRIHPRFADGQDNSSTLWSPALVVGHRYRCDVIFALSASPTTSNGRIVIRVTDLDDTTWNTTGVWYFDTGYTVNVGTVDLDRFRFGHVGGGVPSSTPNRHEHLGWDRIAADITGVTGQANMGPYFMLTPTTAPVAPAATVRPAAVAANPGNWVNDAGAAPTGAALADESDTTYNTNPGNADGESITYSLPPLAAGSVQMQVRMLKPGTGGAPPVRIELLEGASVRATRNVVSTTSTATFDSATGIADYVLDLTGTEVNSISDRTGLALRLTATPA